MQIIIKEGAGTRTWTDNMDDLKMTVLFTQTKNFSESQDNILQNKKTRQSYDIAEMWGKDRKWRDYK